MPGFAEACARLRAVMDPYARTLERAVDRDDELSLNTRHVLANGTPLWFGGPSGSPRRSGRGAHQGLLPTPRRSGKDLGFGFVPDKRAAVLFKRGLPTA